MRHLLSVFVGASTLLTMATAQPAPMPPATDRPLSLGDALQMAVAASPDVAIAAAGIRRAQGELRRARAERLPQLFGTAGYTRTLATEFMALRDDNGPPAPPGPEACAPFAPDPSLPLAEQITTLAGRLECVAHASPIAFGDLFRDLPFGRTNQFMLGLSLAQPVYTGGRLGALARAAGAQQESAEIGMASARAQAVLETAEAYLDAALSDRLLAIAESSVVQADTTLRQALVSLDTGVVAEFEVLRARVQRDNQRSTVVRRRAERDLAHLTLKQLLDLPADAPLHLITDLNDQPAPAVLRLAGLSEGRAAGLSEGVADRAEAELIGERAPIRQAAAAAQAQESRLRITSAQRLPEVTLSSNFARVAYPETFPGWNQFRTNWTVDLTLQVPLFTGGRTGADLRMAEAELAEAHERLRQTRDLADLEVRSVRAQLLAAQAAWEASAGTAEEAAEAVRIVEIRFREGISTQLEVADTQLQREQAEINRAQAARDLQVARIRTELLPFLPLAAPGLPAGPVPTVPAPAPQPVAPAPGGVIRAAELMPAAAGRAPQ